MNTPRNYTCGHMSFNSIRHICTWQMLEGHTYTFFKIEGHTYTFFKIEGHTYTFFKIEGHTYTFFKIEGHTYTFFKIRMSFKHLSDVRYRIERYVSTRVISRCIHNDQAFVKYFTNAWRTYVCIFQIKRHIHVMKSLRYEISWHEYVT